MYIIVAVLVVVIIIAGAAAYVLSTNSGSSNNTSPTPTPAPASVVNASTLQFVVNETTNGANVTYNFTAKNVNTTTLVLRVDIPGGSSGNYSYILDVSQQKSWLSTDNGVTWTASVYNTDWETFGLKWYNYSNALVMWNGVDQTYTYDASTLIYCIAVNPTLPASEFATS